MTIRTHRAAVKPCALLAGAAGLFAAGLCVQPAEAQTADASPVVGVQEVVVTARKRAERLQDVPIADTAVSGRALAENEHLRLDDLNEFAPSANIVVPSPHQTSIEIRGIGANPSNDGLQGSAGVFLDGVYLGRPGMAVFDLIDVTQVEVLRGPQGTLFGKNTTAGAITITTAPPSETPQAVAQVSGGNYGYLQLQGDVSGPLIPGLLAMRLTGYSTVRDGWVTDTANGSHLDGVHTNGARAQLLFTPTPAFRLRLIGEYDFEKDSNGATLFNNLGADPAAILAKFAVIGATADVDPNGETSADDGPTQIKARQNAVTAIADYTVNNFVFTSITGYRNYYYFSYSDVDGTNEPVLNASYAVKDHQFSQELRVATPKSQPVEAVAGLYYFQQAQDVDQLTAYGADAAAFLTGIPNSLLPTYAKYSQAVAAVLAYNGSDWNILSTPDLHSYAAFAQATWHATRTLNVTAGYRETYETNSEVVSRPNPTTASTGAASPYLAYNTYPATEVGRHDWAPSALLTVDYHVTPGVMVYATASEGEKAGGVNASLPASGLGPSSLLVKPEIAENVEAGIKAQFFDHRLVVDFDGFYTKVRDYQATYVETPAGSISSVQILTNAGKVRSDGVEAEVTAVPVKGLTLGATASYVDAVYAQYDDAPCAAEITGQSVCNLTGRPVAGSPKWILNLRAQYERAVAPNLIGFVGAEYAYRSRYYGYLDDSAYAQAGDYSLVNAHLGVRTANGAVEVYGWVKNAANVRYVTGDLNYGSLLPGVYIPFFGEPRTFGLTVRAKY
jgi:iron complex outermembrane receptor protein